MNRHVKFREQLQTKSLSHLTKSLGEIADVLAYQLIPPYTEIKQFKAQEESEGATFSSSKAIYGCPTGPCSILRKA